MTQWRTSQRQTVCINRAKQQQFKLWERIITLFQSFEIEQDINVRTRQFVQAEEHGLKHRNIIKSKQIMEYVH